MKAISSTETSVDFYRTTLHYEPEDRTFKVTAVRTSSPTSFELQEILDQLRKCWLLKKDSAPWNSIVRE
jgi:hypothetical protein